MPKGTFAPLIYSFSANTDLLDPLLHEAHNSECQNLLFPLQIKPVKPVKPRFTDFYFFTPGSNELI